MIRRAATGDERACRALVELHAPAILALARSRLRDRIAAEDVAQDVFVRLFRSLRAFRGESTLRTWLVRTTLNCCADAHRDRIRMDRHVPIDDAAHTLTVDSTDSHDCEARDRVREALDALPDAQRSIVHLRYDTGLSYEQISQVLNIPVGTVGSRLTAALRGLRTTLSLPHAKP